MFPISGEKHGEFLANLVMTASSGTVSDALDISQFEGPIDVFISARASGTNSMATTITHCDTEGGSYTALDTDAVVDPLTGVATAFTAITTSASEQHRVILREYCKRYIKVNFAGTTITQNVAVFAMGTLKQTSDWDD
jgi:hypothetical protein